MIKARKIGISAAASWAWGTSLIMGMEIAQVRGLGAFLVWAVANCLALGVFGFCTKTGILQERIYKIRAIKLFALVIQAFCLIIQLNIIYKILCTFMAPGFWVYCITSIIGAFFVLLMYKHGLPTSILTDVFQWFFALACILVILAIGLFSGVSSVSLPSSSSGDISWAIWSAVILLSGVMGDYQHWQRAKISPKGYYIATGLFALYLSLVFAMAFFEFNHAMNAVLLLATLAITTSTIDSIACAFQEAGNKRIGTAIALILCLAWGLFIKWGVMGIWTNFGAYRVAFAIILLLLSWKYRKKIQKLWGAAKDEN